MRIKRKPGEITEVDWAGKTAFIIDNITGEPIPAYIFVSTWIYRCGGAAVPVSGEPPFRNYRATILV